VIGLFLVRAAYVSLIILGTSLLGEEFPITPKQSALLATITVGIPAFALAVWAKPGRTKKNLLASSAHFIVPAALTIAFVAMSVYLFFRAISDDLTLARSALTTMTVMCGLLLVPFAEPPTKSWTGGDTFSGDWRPTILASTLFGGYFLVLIVDSTRHFYDLGILPYSAYILLAFVAAGWAAWLRYIWRLRIPIRARVILRRRARNRRLHHATTATGHDAR
jgi:cation-transporting P-type ATPase E